MFGKGSYATYFDIFEKAFQPNNFIISKEKYLFMGERAMPECSMVSWLLDIAVESFGSYQTIRCLGRAHMLKNIKNIA